MYRGLVSHSPYLPLAMATAHIGAKLILDTQLDLILNSEIQSVSINPIIRGICWFATGAITFECKPGIGTFENET